jgi:hypothetical protein
MSIKASAAQGGREVGSDHSHLTAGSARSSAADAGVAQDSVPVEAPFVLRSWAAFRRRHNEDEKKAGHVPFRACGIRSLVGDGCVTCR